MRSFFVYVMRNPREEHTLVGIYYGPDVDAAIEAMRQDRNVPDLLRTGFDPRAFEIGPDGKELVNR